MHNISFIIIRVVIFLILVLFGKYKASQYRNRHTQRLLNYTNVRNVLDEK